MNSNDIAVRLDALNTGSYKLGHNMDELEQLAEQLRHNMAIVGKEFDSVNFERADEVVQDVIFILRSVSEQLQRGRKFLGELEDKAEDYLNCKFKE